MLAFTKTTMTKGELLKELRIHEKADNIIKGTYVSETSKTFKGCAVGCSLESLSRKKGIDIGDSFGNHALYEPHFGVPRWLARMEDRIFEGLPIEDAKKWPVAFTSAINPGSDLNKILKPYMAVICDAVIPFVDHQKYPAIVAGITLIAKLLRNKKTTREQFIAARNDIIIARRPAAAYAADAADAYAADAYAAAAAAAYAADAYAADAYAADAYAAAAAAYAADAAAYAADADAAAARFKMYTFLAAELIKLIKGCKGK